MKKRISAPQKIRSLLESRSALFDTRTLAGLWGLQRQSAKVEASRLIKAGILKPLRRGLYCLAVKEPTDFEIANALYQPSVLSLESALNYWGILVQAPQTVTSIADKSRRFVVRKTEFVYRRVPRRLLEIGTVEERGFFIAKPEKGILDYLYLGLKGIYTINIGDLFLTKGLDLKGAEEYLPFYPFTYQVRIKKLMSELAKRGYRGVR